MRSALVLLVGLAVVTGCATDEAPFSDHEELADLEEVSADGKADGVPSVFNKNRVVDDDVFVGAGAMTVADVQKFLERSPYGTRSWLASYEIDGKSAAQAIVDAAAGEDINPMALLVRMQVEASIVSKTVKPSQTLLNQALGCGCPDGGSCSAQYRGLGKQLVCGAKIFRKWYDASVAGTGQYRVGKTTSTLDGSVKPITHATASLYAYTPWIQSNKLVWNIYRKYVAHGESIGVFHPGTVTPTDPPPSGDWWKPTAGTSWQIELNTGAIDTSFNVRVYDVDLFETSAQTIAALKADGRKVVCYFSAGSHENWRPDASQYPASTLGNGLDGWPGEKWIDTRSPAVRTALEARMDLAKTKGCDGIDPDNVDGYTNNPGFPLTAATQLDFNKFLAAEGHARGLAVGLKNDMDQIAELVSYFDFTVNEQCFEYDECDTLTPFIAAGKPVWQLEYGTQSRAAAVCADANARNFDTLVKNLDLDAARISCR